jgi:hypothetical protein
MTLVGIRAGSLHAIAWWAGGVVAGIILMVILGTIAVQVFSPGAMATQGGGIAYIVVLLPFFIYLGSVAAAWAIAMGYWFFPGHRHFASLQGVGLVGSLLLSLLCARALAPVFNFLLRGLEDNLLSLGILAIISGILGAIGFYIFLRWSVNYLL